MCICPYYYVGDNVAWFLNLFQEVLRLGWWGGLVNNTNVCNEGKPVTHEKKAVALNYRLKIEDGHCVDPFVATNTSFKEALQYEVNISLILSLFFNLCEYNHQLKVSLF